VTRRVRGKAYEYHAVRFADPGTGNEKIRYFKSEKEAKRARIEIEGRVATGTYAEDGHKVTVRTIAERWRKAAYSPRRADELRSTTSADYETALERYILPRWGAVRMVDIRASNLEGWRNELLEKGIEPDWKPIGASTVRKALLVVGILFRFAMRDHIVAVNPASFVKKPSVRTRKAAEERLTPEQLSRLFADLKARAAIEESKRRERERRRKKEATGYTVNAPARTLIVVRVGAATGMREGEIFGLRWRDVDLKERLIHVRRQFTHGEFVEFPKTEAGCRDIGIDGKLAAELSAWKLAQEAERRKDDSLVVPSEKGGPMSASNFLSREFYPALKAAKLPRVVFHSLRHTASTILASSNIPPGTVHRILGHASFATTMKLYGGLTADALKNAAGTLGDAFEPKPDKNRTNDSSAVEK
jgi:integrase